MRAEIDAEFEKLWQDVVRCAGPLAGSFEQSKSIYKSVYEIGFMDGNKHGIAEHQATVARILCDSITK